MTYWYDVAKQPYFHEKYILQWLMDDEWMTKNIKQIVQSIELHVSRLKIDSMSFWCVFIEEKNNPQD